MKLRFLVPAVLFALGAFASSAMATEISSFTGSVSTSNPTQLGRPSRNGIPQTWAYTEAYPGVLASTVNTTYYYTTYTFTQAMLQQRDYVDISIFDETNSGLFFVSAYANSYNPSSRATNWLGDEGSSGNIVFFTGTTGNARSFDVILPYNGTLVLVVNTTGGGTSGTGALYDIDINAYADNNFDETVAYAPEPSTFIELGTGLLAMAGVARRRLMAA